MNFSSLHCMISIVLSSPNQTFARPVLDEFRWNHHSCHNFEHTFSFIYFLNYPLFVVVTVCPNSMDNRFGKHSIAFDLCLCSIWLDTPQNLHKFSQRIKNDAKGARRSEFEWKRKKKSALILKNRTCVYGVEAIWQEVEKKFTIPNNSSSLSHALFSFQTFNWNAFQWVLR